MPLSSPTFGFESEWEEGGPELAQQLYALGLVGSPELHSYHCDCDYCDFSGEYPLRVQRDSTCSGEVISSPYDSNDSGWLDHLNDLQAAALEVDAVPGWQAGFHVHVSRRHLRGDEQRGLVLFAAAKWEGVLRYLAAGRFPNQREMNQPLRRVLRSAMGYVLEDVAPTMEDARSFEWAAANVLNGDEGDATHMLEDLYRSHCDNDRHSNLNVRTSHPTFEFRFWNSTRSAWRMELWCRLSLALMDTDVARAMAYHPTTAGPGHGVLFAEVLNNQGHSRCAELVERQLAYLTSDKATLAGAFAA